MKRATGLLLAGFVFLSCSSVYHSTESNKECAVLITSIANDYEGYCKNGFAHGEGVASGLHSYEGEFIGGYPDGEGTYRWSDERVYSGKWRKGQQYSFGELDYTENGESKKLSGFWYEGELKVISDDDRPYRIGSQSGVVSTSLRRIGPEYDGKMTLKFRRNGEDVRNVITSLNISHSSGNMPNQPGSNTAFDYVIENVTFPLELYISYKIPNLMNTTLIDNRVQVDILEPGEYVINFDNN